MSKKLSHYTLAKIVRLLVQGNSQSAVAKTLGIDQSTVSKHQADFEALAKEEGIQEAAGQYEVAADVKELLALSTELKASHLTVAEAKAGHKMAEQFAANGIPTEEYGNHVKALKRLRDETFLASAIKLAQLEDTSRMTHQEIVSQATSSQEQLAKTKQELHATEGKLKATKAELTGILEEKKAASEDFQQMMQKLGVDYKRLGKIESLATALKKAGITDDELDTYLKRQNLINAENLSILMLTDILKETKVSLADGGQSLLQKLKECNGLQGAVASLEKQQQTFITMVGDLNDKAKLRGKLEAETIELESKRSSLETKISQLQAEEKKTTEELKVLSVKRDSLAHQAASLAGDVAAKQQLDSELDSSIAEKKESLSDLTKLETKHNFLLSEIEELTTRAVKEKRHLAVSDAIVGLVQEEPLKGLEILNENLPSFIIKAKGDEYSPKLLRDFVLQQLTGGKLQVLHCLSCGGRFTVDKPAGPGGYYCPKCGYSTQIKVEKNETEIITGALQEPKTEPVETVTFVHPKQSILGKE